MHSGNKVCQASSHICDCKHAKQGLNRTSCTKQVADRAFRAAHGDLAILLHAFLAQHQGANGPSLCRVTNGGARRMSVDIVDLAWFDICVPQGPFHGQQGPRAVLPGRCHVVRVATAAVAGQLGQNVCTSGHGVLKLFQNEHSGALSNDKTVAVLIEGAAAGAGIMVEGGR